MSEEMNELEKKELVETGETENSSESFENIIYDWARCLLSAVVGVVLLFTFAVRMIGVSGGS
ncbi:MAG: hypothetical protein IKC03_10025, partial [Oscillospiraceae bacterium]|nr:hypothetical protein [Oscillospiraceae bacterium]